MKDVLISWIRTTLPYAWSLLVAWAISHGLPVEVTDWLSGLGEQITNLVVAGVLYALARWVEPHLPDWLTRVVFGSAASPSYGQVAAETGVVVDVDAIAAQVAKELAQRGRFDPAP